MSEQKEKIITISCAVEEDNEGKPSFPQGGKHLVLEISLQEVDIKKEVTIKYEKFTKVFDEARKRQSCGDVVLRDPVLMENDPAVPDQEIDVQKEPDLLEVMNFLLEEIKEGTGIILPNNECNELQVISQDSLFLELPWEYLFSRNDIFVVRITPSLRSSKSVGTRNAFAFLVSGANDNNDDLETKAAEVRKTGNQEITDVFSLIKKIRESETPSKFRIDSVLLSPHTTKKNVEEVDWKKYDYVHMIMHGKPNGQLCLEQPNNHKKIDGLNIGDFINLIKEKDGNFRTSVLSLCYSGGGVKSGAGLAFQLVREGLSETAIGYIGRASDLSALNFTVKFYGFLFHGERDDKGSYIAIKEVYKKALRSYHQGEKNKKNIPVFYMVK